MKTLNNIDTKLEPQIVLQKIIEKFNYSLNILDNKEFSIYKSLFYTVEDLEFFKNTFITLFGVEKFVKFEEEYSKRLLLALKDFINNNNYHCVLKYDDYNNVYISVEINISNYTYNIFNINPYLHIIFYEDMAYKNILKKELDTYNNQLDELKEYEKYLMAVKKNPLLSVNTPKELIDTLFKKNKVKNKLDTEMRTNNDNIDFLLKKIVDCKQDLEEIDDYENQVMACRKELLTYLKGSKFEYYIIDDKNNEINTKNDEI